VEGRSKAAPRGPECFPGVEVGVSGVLRAATGVGLPWFGVPMRIHE